MRINRSLTLRIPPVSFALLALALTLVPHSATTSPSATDRSHPFLLVTTADIERARDGLKHSSVFAGLAKELTARATTNRVEDLPPLEREWWQAARQQPWSATYPEIFHHTFIVPMKWAELARNCARANLVVPSPQLAAKAKRLLLQLSDYTFEFDHYDVGMNYTIWTLAAHDTYDILYADLTAAERARMDAFFERYLAALRKSDDYWIEHEPGGRLNNHYAWHKLGLGMIGVFYGRPELVERALRGPKGVEQMLAQGFKDDGLWLEGSIPYQFAETAPLVILAQMLENARYPENLFCYRSPNAKLYQRGGDRFDRENPSDYNLVWHYDQPYADPSALPSYYVAQMTRSHVKVALNGTVIVDADQSKIRTPLDHQAHPGLHNAKGYISWLGHGDPPDPVAFRNVRIKELP